MSDTENIKSASKVGSDLETVIRTVVAVAPCVVRSVTRRVQSGGEILETTVVFDVKEDAA